MTRARARIKIAIRCALYTNQCYLPGGMSLGSLCVLPFEVLLTGVLSKLNAHDLARLARTCRWFRDIIAGESTLLGPGTIRHTINMRADRNAQANLAMVRVLTGSLYIDCAEDATRFSRLERVVGSIFAHSMKDTSVTGLTALTLVGGSLDFSGCSNVQGYPAVKKTGAGRPVSFRIFLILRGSGWWRVLLSKTTRPPGVFPSPVAPSAVEADRFS